MNKTVGLKFLGFFCLVGIISVLSYWQYLNYFGQSPGPTDVKVELEIERGTSPRRISQMLEDQGLVSSGSNFYAYLRFVEQKAPDLKAGFYRLNGRMSPSQIIELLQRGLKKEIRFTFPEGANKEEIAEAVAESGLAGKKEMLKAMASFRFTANMFDTNPPDVEGYLFPDTYQFEPGTEPSEMVSKMVERTQEVFSEALKIRMKELGFKTHKVLTLASIVEKETGVPEERPLIASVFFNRLKKNMRLQSDPTVIYGIKNYRGNIKKRHLTSKHAYNTYAHRGLPPGPIASPGLEAIQAVLWPEQTDFLYFVSRNDGSHEFCPTYSCHQKAVHKWQVKFFRDRRRKSKS